MSIASQITRIQTDRNTIRAKMVELGLATNTDNLDVLAESIDEIVNQGSVSASVKEGETYTIPKGYHSGSGTVSGIAGGGNYTLQSKAAVTPTKKQQQITPDDGYYGLSDVTVGAIPDAYQDVTSVTAGAGDVLNGKVIVSKEGTIVTGTMTDNGAVSKTLTTSDASYTVPAGKHSGTGTVKIVPEDKSVTPTKAAQDITATTGKVLNKVSVAPIPDEYQDVTPVTAEAADVLTGKKIVAADGTVVDGTMRYVGVGKNTLNTAYNRYTLDTGYRGEEAYVSVDAEAATVTPTKNVQTVEGGLAIPIGPVDDYGYTSNTGVTDKPGKKFLTSVTVNPIPDEYQVVTGVTAGAADVLVGKVIVDATGAEIEGTMADNGTVTATIDGLTTMSYTIPAGKHSGTGTVSLTSDIEEALAAI